MNIELQKNSYSGKLIAFCGVDGAGKTTLINEFTEYLESKYGKNSYIQIKQPRQEIRDMELFRRMNSEDRSSVNYIAYLLLCLSDRIQQKDDEIIPALMQGKIVICDRYIFTTIAVMLSRGYTNETWFLELIKRHILAPDITFFADVPPELAIQRVLAREEEKDKYLDKHFVFELVHNFRFIQQDAKFVRLDTSGDSTVSTKTVIERFDELWTKCRRCEN